MDKSQYWSGFSSLWCKLVMFGICIHHMWCAASDNALRWPPFPVNSILSWDQNEGRKEEGSPERSRQNSKEAHANCSTFLLLLIYAVVLLKNAGLAGTATAQIYRPVHCTSTSLKEDLSNGALCSYKAKDFRILGQRCWGRSMIYTQCVFYGIKDLIWLEKSTQNRKDDHL